ncbi:MAG: D-glycero-beta-D-manno-heptose 1,7-bisphosphate 7-phosphatase [Pseudomonadota bacterium]
MSNKPAKLVILDRDGVINIPAPERGYVTTPSEWEPLPGALNAIARLNRAGYRVVIATNQAGIGRGVMTIEALHQVHEKLHDRLMEHGGHIDAIFYCPHRPDDRCECRKPKPGMLLNIAERLHCSLDGVPFVGDSHRDISAAIEAGASPVLVLTGDGESTEHELTDRERALTSVFSDLGAMVDEWLTESPTIR